MAFAALDESPEMRQHLNGSEIIINYNTKIIQEELVMLNLNN